MIILKTDDVNFCCWPHFLIPNEICVVSRVPTQSGKSGNSMEFCNDILVLKKQRKMFCRQFTQNHVESNSIKLDIFYAVLLQEFRSLISIVQAQKNGNSATSGCLMMRSATTNHAVA